MDKGFFCPHRPEGLKIVVLGGFVVDGIRSKLIYSNWHYAINLNINIL